MQKNTSFELNETFRNEQSMIMTNDHNIIFQNTFPVRPFNPKEAPQLLEKLRLILNEKYEEKHEGVSEDYFSPTSDDANFEIDQTDPDVMNEIINFPYKQFFKKVLRRRTNFIGMEKDEQDILVHKPKPLSKSLTMINEKDEKDAIKIFKLLLKIG